MISLKMNLLSRSEEKTLLKSVETLIPIYTMQNLWIPFDIYDNIDVIVHSFIWGGILVGLIGRA